MVLGQRLFGLKKTLTRALFLPEELSVLSPAAVNLPPMEGFAPRWVHTEWIKAVKAKSPETL